MTSPSNAAAPSAQELAQVAADRSPRRRWPALGFAIVVLALALLPAVSGAHLTGLVGRLLVFGLLAISLDLLWGYTGQLSLGHAAFFGLGAYAAGLILAEGQGIVPSLAAIVLAVGLPALLGLIMGYLLFRGGVGGVYFGIITLLVSLLLEQLANTWTSFTGGSNGVLGIGPLELGFITVGSLHEAYYTILVVVALAFLAVYWLTRTPFGRAMTAIRSHEHRAHSLGLSVVAIKTTVLTISCGLAGLAGLLYVPLERFVYPTQLGLIASTGVVVWVVVGGRGTLVGPVIGAFAVEYLASALSGTVRDYWTLILGLFLIAIVVLRPGGLYGLLVSGWERTIALARPRSRSDA